MSLRRIGAEHSIDVDLLPERPMVLDVGARDFEFDRELLKLRPEATIIALEPDPAVEDPRLSGVVFLNAAMTGRDVERVVWQGPGEGAYICENRGDPGYGLGVRDAKNSVSVENFTVEGLARRFAVERFDLVKLDCEGSEFGILEAWPGPIARQLSVEFHDTVNPSRWDGAYFARLFSGPLRDYEVRLFEVTPLGPRPSYGHWDSVFSLRNGAAR